MRKSDISNRELHYYFRKAFMAGQDWAEIYSPWFSPTKGQTEERMRKAVNVIVREAGGMKLD